MECANIYFLTAVANPSLIERLEKNVCFLSFYVLIL